MLKSCKPGKRLRNTLERNKKFAIMTIDVTCYPPELNINQPKVLTCLSDASKKHGNILTGKTWHKQLPIKCPSCWSSLRIPFRYVPAEEIDLVEQGATSKFKHSIKKRYRHGLIKKKMIIHNELMEKSKYSKFGARFDEQEKQVQDYVKGTEDDVVSNTDEHYNSFEHYNSPEIVVEREHTYAIPTTPKVQLQGHSEPGNQDFVDKKGSASVNGECSTDNHKVNIKQSEDASCKKKECKVQLPTQRKCKKRKVNNILQHQPRMTLRGRILKMKKYLD